jgi:hypothetical protein
LLSELRSVRLPIPTGRSATVCASSGHDSAKSIELLVERPQVGDEDPPIKLLSERPVLGQLDQRRV